MDGADMSVCSTFVRLAYIPARLWRDPKDAGTLLADFWTEADAMLTEMGVTR